VTLGSNTASAVGDLGQFATGTLTADATTELVTFTGEGIIDGARLRDITPAPAGLALFGGGLGGLGLIRRLHRG
jgi:hypothetical protein